MIYTPIHFSYTNVEPMPLNNIIIVLYSIYRFIIVLSCYIYMIIQSVPPGSGSNGDIRCWGFHHRERGATTHAQTMRQSGRL